jgi:hypothetical protein
MLTAAARVAKLIAILLTPLAVILAAAVPAQAGTTVPNTQDLVDVACPSSSSCIAVGYGNGNGAVVPITHGVPGTPHRVPGTAALSSVACPTSSTCYAVGIDNLLSTGQLVAIHDGLPGKPIAVKTKGVTTNGIACVTSTTCYAVGGSSNGGAVLTVTRGLPGKIKTVPSINGLNDISCPPNSTTCVAVGLKSPITELGEVVRISGGSPVGSAKVASGTTTLEGTTCKTPTSCIGVGNHGFEHNGSFEQDGVFVPINGGRPGAVKAVTTTKDLDDIACVSSTVCLAVGTTSTSHGAKVPISNGKANPTGTFPSVSILYGVTCPTSKSCDGVGQSSSGLGDLVTSAP